jgi:hypothetical protein
MIDVDIEQSHSCTVDLLLLKNHEAEDDGTSAPWIQASSDHHTSQPVSARSILSTSIPRGSKASLRIFETLGYWGDNGAPGEFIGRSEYVDGVDN